MKNSVFVLVVFLLVSGCRSSEQCRVLLEEKCIQCHGLATSCAKTGESEERWLGILEAMAKLKADISAKERKTLAGCLSKPSAEVEGICR